MSKDMRDWPRANLGVAANIFKHLKTTCRSACSSVPRVKTLENPQPEPDAESLASFHLALRTTQEMANNFGQAAHQFNLLGKNKQGNNKDKNNIEQP